MPNYLTTATLQSVQSGKTLAHRQFPEGVHIALVPLNTALQQTEAAINRGAVPF